MTHSESAEEILHFVDMGCCLWFWTLLRNAVTYVMLYTWWVTESETLAQACHIRQ